jgi:hypothetical protein
MAPERESNTAPTCFFESSVSFEMVARISDLVGAAFFFAIIISYVSKVPLGAVAHIRYAATRFHNFNSAPKIT